MFSEFAFDSTEYSGDLPCFEPLDDIIRYIDVSIPDVGIEIGYRSFKTVLHDSIA